MFPALQCRLPGEIRRLAVLIVIAALGATAVRYSRNEAAEDGSRALKQASHQPTDDQQADGWFTPTATVSGPAESSTILEVAKLFPPSLPLPRARPRITPGFYYELVRARPSQIAAASSPEAMRLGKSGIGMRTRKYTMICTIKAMMLQITQSTKFSV